MADNGKMFRTSISGFNKDDVNRYILEMDRKNKEKTDKLTKDLEDMTQNNRQLSETIAEMENANAQQNSKLAELEAEIARLQEENKAQAESLADITKRHDFYRIQTEAQNEALTKAKEERTALTERVDALTEESRTKDAQIKANAEKYAADIETLRSAYENEIKQIKDAAKVDDGVAYKLDMYDRISSQIGDILINANRNSDEIITAAKNEAEKLISQTNANAEESAKKMRDGIKSCAENTMDELKNEFSSNVSSCVREIQTCITDIQYETNALLSFLNQKQNEMNERIDFYHNNISESVEGKVNSLDMQCTAIIKTEGSAK